MIGRSDWHPGDDADRCAAGSALPAEEVAGDVGRDVRPAALDLAADGDPVHATPFRFAEFREGIEMPDASAKWPASLFEHQG